MEAGIAGAAPSDGFAISIVIETANTRPDEYDDIHRTIAALSTSMCVSCTSG